MELIKLSVRNLYSYKNETIDFTKYNSPVFIRGRTDDKNMTANGAGKSRIPNLICWVLFGKDFDGVFGTGVLRDDLKDGKVNDGWAVLIFKVNNVTYYIRRHYWNRKRKSYKAGITIGFFDNGRKQNIINKYSRTDKLAIQKIQDIIGYDYNSFRFISYLTPNDNLFLLGKDSDRFDIFTSLCGKSLVEADSVLSIVKEDAKKYNKKLIKLDGESDANQHHLDNYDLRKLNRKKNKSKRERDEFKKYISDTLDKLDSIKDYIYDTNISFSLKKKLDGDKRTIETKAKTTKEDKKKLRILKRDLGEKEERIKRSLFRENKLKSNQVKVVKLNKTISNTFFRMSRHKDSIDNNMIRIDEISELKNQGKCPLCKTKVGQPEVLERLENEKATIIKMNTDLKKNIRKNNTKMKKAKQSLEELKVRIEKLEIYLDSIKKDRTCIMNIIINDIPNLERKISDGIMEVNRLAEGIKKNRQDLKIVKARLDKNKDLEHQEEGFRRALISYEDQVDIRSKEIGKIEQIETHVKTAMKEIKRLNKEKSEYINKLENIKWCLNNIPIIKSNIMKVILDKLERKTNEYMSYLFPDVAVSYNLITGEGNKRNRFQIIVTDRRTDIKRQFVQWSGGEKKRISVSVILALNWLVGIINPNNKIDFLFLDEIFGGLDAIGRECVMDVSTLGDRKVYIITHIDDIERMGQSNVMTVNKVNGVSSVQ